MDKNDIATSSAKLCARAAQLLTAVLTVSCLGQEQPVLRKNDDTSRSAPSGVQAQAASIAPPARVPAVREQRDDQVIAKLSQQALLEVQRRGYRVRRLGGDTYVVSFDASGGLTPELVITELNALSGSRAQPDFTRYVLALPNDPDIDPVNRAPAHLFQVKAPAAWDTTTGAGRVIAVIDTGVDWQHQDLAGNVWNNAEEVAGDGVDNDQNGYVDDHQGWDFVTAPADQVAAEEDPGPPDNDPMDVYGHGTHVSGIAAAVGNNGVGAAGIAYGAKIMALRAGYKRYDGAGVLDDSDIIEAIYYAANHGAHVINMSFGGFDLSPAEKDAIDYAVSKGVVLVAAAGNEGNSAPHYPASYGPVLSVAALDGSSTPEAQAAAYFTTYGSSVDIAAPGMSIFSTLVNQSYGAMSGTSMAAPVVAGAAALVQVAHPSWTREQVMQQLMATADDVDSFQRPEYVGMLGTGRVDIEEALGAAKPLPQFVRLAAAQLHEGGDRDGELEPGETFEVYVSAESVFQPTALRATLTTADPYLSITPAEIDLGTVAAGATATAKFLVTVGSTMPRAHAADLNAGVTGGRTPLSRKISELYNPVVRPVAHVGTTRHYAQLPVALADGSVLFVTDEADGVYATLRRADGSWTAHERISAPPVDAKDYTQAPDVFLGADGLVHIAYFVVHQIPDPSAATGADVAADNVIAIGPPPPPHHRNAEVMVQTLDPSTFTWSSGELVGSAYFGLALPGKDNDAYQGVVEVVADSSGAKHVAWSELGQGTPRISYGFSSGSTWTSSALVDLPAETNSPLLTMLVMPDGTRRLFYDARQNRAVLASGWFTGSGASWSQLGSLPTYADHLEPFIQGGTIRMFYQETEAPHRLMLARIAGSTWVTDQLVSENFTGGYSLRDTYIDVAMSPEGDVIVGDVAPIPGPTMSVGVYFRTGKPGSLVTYTARVRQGLDHLTPAVAAAAGGVAHLFFSSGASRMDGAKYYTNQVGTFQPLRPAVVDQGDATSNSSSLVGSWSSNGLPVSKYSYALGTSPGASDVAGWTETTNATETVAPPGGLRTRQRYFFSAYAYAADGRGSSLGISDGICISDCTNRVCGDDGCGGICGATGGCPGGQACSADGQCGSDDTCASEQLSVVATRASSIENAGTPAANATDGNAATRWSSQFSDPQWLELDLGQQRYIDRVALQWEAAASARYDVQVSDDAATWTTVQSELAGNGGADELTGLNARARFVRIYSHARTTPYGVSLWEAKVYGDDASCGCDTTQLPVTSTRASSQENADTGAARSVDGNPQTRWSSQFADPQWLELDLGSESLVERVELSWEAAASRSYQVQVSNDAASWSTVYSTTAGDGGLDDLTNLGASGRYLRIYSTARTTAYGVSLWEVRVFGNQTPSCVGSDPIDRCGREALSFASASASSTQGNDVTLAAGKAIDANRSTRWSSAFSDPQWIVADLGAPRYVSELSLYWETAYSADYDLAVSLDGTTYTTVKTGAGRSGAADTTVLTPGVVARYVRMYSRRRATAWGNSLFEIEAFGDTDAACEP